MVLRYKNPRALFIPANHDWWWHPCYLIRRHLLMVIREGAKNLDGRILDFGCGGKPYKEFFSGKNYVGVDIAVSGHDHTNSDIDFFYDGHVLDFPDASFDAVFSSEVMEHLFNYDEILPEIRRVLRPNGKFFLTTPFLWPEHEKPYDYARYTTFGLKALLEKHGFAQVSVERRGHAIEGICQLALLYAMDKFLPSRAKLQRLTSFFWCSFFNLIALVGRKAFPAYSDIYLTNVAMAVKPVDVERSKAVKP